MANVKEKILKTWLKIKYRHSILAAIVMIPFVLLVFNATKVSKYTLAIEYCSGKKDTVVILRIFKPRIITHKEAVPVIYYEGGSIVNVCSLTILKRESND